MMNDVLVPSRSVIDGWSSLQTQPIVEVVPRSSPRSAYLRYPVDQNETRRLALKSGFPAVENIKTMMKLDEHGQEIQDHLVRIYTERGIGRIIQHDYLEPAKQENNGEIPEVWKTEDARNIAMQLLSPKVDYLDSMITSVQNCAKTIESLFLDKDLWTTGKYSDEMLKSLAKLLFNMTCLEQLAPVKPAMNDDVSFLKKYSMMGANQDPVMVMKLMTIQQWVANTRAARMFLMKQLEKMNYQQTMAVFNVIYPFTKAKIEEDLFFAEERFAYINMLIFIVSLYEQQMNLELDSLKNEKLAQYKREAEKKSTKGKTVKPKPLTEDKIRDIRKKMNYKQLSLEIRMFVKEVADKYKIMPLFMEVASETTYNLPTGVLQISESDTKKMENSPQLNVPNFETLLVESRNIFSKLSYCVSKMLTVAEDRVVPSYANMLIDILPKVIKHFSLVVAHIRQVHVDNIIHAPPPDPTNEEQKNWSAFERSMKIGMSDVTDNGKVARFLLLLCISRSAKELIQAHLPRIVAHVSYYISQYMQDFAWNQIPVIISKNHGTKTNCIKILERLRVLIGSFKAGEVRIDERSKKFGKNPVPALSAAPHRDIIELARIQIQLLINPGSENMKMSGMKAMQKFLEDTTNFDALLRLDEAMNDAFDQSALYFRETCLAVSGKSFFPVTTSLPMVLSSFAMDHYQNPELTNAIFYPLSIYDDAASKALRCFKSKCLYDEIKAEANICLIAIMRLITDSAYLPIRRFSLLKLISRKMSESIIPKLPGENPDAPFQESIICVRVGVVLQQNQLEVLGCPIDVRVLIASRLNELMSEEIQKVAGLINKDGLLVTVAVNKLMEVLRNTNTIFAGFGLPMMSFDDQIARVLSTDTPNTFNSGLLINCTNHLIETVVNDYYLITNPLRLIPSIPPKIDYEGLFVGNASNVGLIASHMVSPTSAFISVENFRELFWMINDGSIKVMHDYIIDLIPDIFQQFLTCYQSMGNRLKRIRDAPIGSATVQVFDMFEGAYRFFTKDPNMVGMFSAMRALGNIIGICEMMDNAFALKQGATQQVGAFLLGQNPHSEKESDIELFDIFDAKFKAIRQMMTNTYKIPGNDELLQPFLFHALGVLVPLIIQNQDTFAETSPNLLDITTSTGFATKWGIIEFLFILMEATRTVKKETEGEEEDEEEDDEDKIDLGSLGKYGEAILIVAGIIICSMEQKPLYKMTAIGNRIKAHQIIAFDSAKEPRVQQFLAVNEMVSASMSSALAAYQTAIYHILGK